MNFSFEQNSYLLVISGLKERLEDEQNRPETNIWYETC